MLGVDVELEKNDLNPEWSLSVKAPTRDEVIAYASGLGIAGTPAATFWAHGDSTSWTFHDGEKVRDWKACFRLWVERMQGRPGFEIVLHDTSRVRSSGTIAEAEREQMKKEWKAMDIVKNGRQSKASDENIIAVLRSRGLVWPDFADVRYEKPANIK